MAPRASNKTRVRPPVPSEVIRPAHLRHHVRPHGQGVHLEGVNNDEALRGAPGGTAGWGNFRDDSTVDEAPALKGVTVGAAILHLEVRIPLGTIVRSLH